MPAISTTSDTLEKAWASVYGESQDGGGYYSVRVFGESICSVFVGQHQPSGLIDFAFEVPPKSIKKIQLSQEAKGFEVKVQKTFNAANSKVLRVSICLNRNSFLDLFKVLAADIVEHCLSAATEAEARQSFIPGSITGADFQKRPETMACRLENRLGYLVNSFFFAP